MNKELNKSSVLCATALERFTKIDSSLISIKIKKFLCAYHTLKGVVCWNFRMLRKI